MSAPGLTLYATLSVGVDGTSVAELEGEALEKLVQELDGSVVRLSIDDGGLVKLEPVDLVKQEPSYAKQNGRAAKQLLSVAEICEETGLSRALVYREMRLGNCPYRLFGGKKLIVRSEFYAWGKREAERASGNDL